MEIPLPAQLLRMSQVESSTGRLMTRGRAAARCWFQISITSLWQGIVGEDGVDGVSFGPQGLGYRHFLYQTFLRNLKGIGVLLAGVTRNDRELALGPLSKPESVLEPDDFVSIAASYHAKSAQIEMLAEHLNLGLGEFRIR